jgi:hypothetical protein
MVDRSGVALIQLVDMRTVYLAIALIGFSIAPAGAISVSSNSYAAIAYSPSTGKFAYSYDRRSRKEAEKEALEKCGAPDATIACWVNRGYAALALGKDKSCWGSGWKYGDNASNEDAKDMAMKDCQKRTSDVYIAVCLSSDGQHLWDHRDHTTIIDKNGNITDGYGRPILPTPSPSGSAGLEKK